jgi:hypothetical protein
MTTQQACFGMQAMTMTAAIGFLQTRLSPCVKGLGASAFQTSLAGRCHT